MSTTTASWDDLRTPETRAVEDRLRAHFDQADSYRYNSASIRVRVIDQAFEGKSREERDGMVEKVIAELPQETQRDIVTLFAFAPSDLLQGTANLRDYFLNQEFEKYSRSTL